MQTVFFGGGTPSLMPPALLAQLLDALRSVFGVAPDAEVSMEADPGEHTPHLRCRMCVSHRTTNAHSLAPGHLAAACRRPGTHLLGLNGRSFCRHI